MPKTSVKYQRLWHKKHPHYQAEYYQLNARRLRKYYNDRYAKLPEDLKEKRREYIREWKANNPDKLKGYWKTASYKRQRSKRSV